MALVRLAGGHIHELVVLHLLQTEGVVQGDGGDHGQRVHDLAVDSLDRAFVHHFLCEKRIVRVVHVDRSVIAPHGVAALAICDSTHPIGQILGGLLLRLSDNGEILNREGIFGGNSIGTHILAQRGAQKRSVYDKIEGDVFFELQCFIHQLGQINSRKPGGETDGVCSDLIALHLGKQLNAHLYP